MAELRTRARLPHTDGDARHEHAPTFDTVQVGDALPPLQLPPVDRTTLALFAGASGDHNPIHIDIDFARRAGMPDVFAHGMLSAWPGSAGC